MLPIPDRRPRFGLVVSPRLVAVAAALVVLLTMDLSRFPAWGEWLSLAILVAATVIGVGQWLNGIYARWVWLKFCGNSRQITVPLGGSWVPVELTVRQPLSLIKVRVCLSEKRNGKERPSGRPDLRVTNIDDGCSPSQIDADYIRRSYSRLELWCSERPILVDPGEPWTFSVKVECSHEWSGYLVFVGWDDERYQRCASIELSLTPDETRLSAS